MFQKPKFRSREYATTFQEKSVTDVYHYRAPYPDETFQILSDLIVDEPRRVLDVGTGQGNIARPLLPFVERIDAVDFSENMIESGKQLPGGKDAKLTWILGEMEAVCLNGPYALITAGESLHWFDHNVVMGLFVNLLSPNGYLAVIERICLLAVRDGDIIAKYSANKDYEPYNLLKALEEAGLFEKVGLAETKSEVWTPTVADFLNFRHSQNGLSRERMGEADATAFDLAVRARIADQVKEGTVKIVDKRLQGAVMARVIWGKPLA